MQTTDGNKIAMAVLGTLTFVMLTSFAGELSLRREEDGQGGL